MSYRPPSRLAAATLAASVAGCGLLAILPAPAVAAPPGFLAGLHRFTTLGSTVPDNGDQNPYAVVVSPVSAGKIRQADVLMTNFNDARNLQGTGSTIVAYRPETKAVSLFAAIPQGLPGCPGGIGLTTALAVLQSGWVIAGSLPSRDGTTATKGQGCLVVLDSEGRTAGTIADPAIAGPWGNMAVIDRGASASLFVSTVGAGVGAPGQAAVSRADVLRIGLAVPQGAPPVVTSETVIASGFGAQADKDVFIIGPTGLALGAGGVLFVSDAIGNRIVAIPDAAERSDSAGTGTEVTKGGLLQRPLALAAAPDGHLLAVNGLDGRCVEIDPATGRQLGALWLDRNRAQTPPGSGDLFGLAVAPEGGLYFVKDEMNTLVLAR